MPSLAAGTAVITPERGQSVIAAGGIAGSANHAMEEKG
jgi:hypothetical protein